MTSPEAETVAQTRGTLMRGVGAAALIFVAIWLLAWYLTPPMAGMEAPGARLIFAMLCCCVATLFCLVAGIEAVAHDRLNSAAINPLIGAESERLKVNLHYLQNTLEQLVVFIPGLLGLAYYSTGIGPVVATTLTWVLGRWVFWIGYHIGQQFRAPGLFSMAQGLLVLLYVCARFGYQYAGAAGAAAIVVLYLWIEAFLVYVTRHPAKT
jgi:MAPEG family